MSDQLTEQERTAKPRGGRRKAALRRSIAALTVSGAAAAVLVTTAAGGVQTAAAAESSAALRGAVTSTVTSSSSAGNLTVGVKYGRTAHGGIKIASVTYSGGAKAAVRHPALIITFSSGGPPQPVPGQRRIHGFLVVLRLKVADAKSFSGSLSAHQLAALNKAESSPAGRFGGTLSATLASVVKQHRGFTARQVIQAGLLLSGA